ncbi:MAG: hypothetical protein Q4A41_01875 [Bacillota bacterium]|nr:hypothetical protein [Bacillota bacterium]
MASDCKYFGVSRTYASKQIFAMSMIPLFVASVIGIVVGFLLVEMVTMNIYRGAIQESKIGGEIMKKLVAPIEMRGYSGIIGEFSGYLCMLSLLG